MEDLDDLAVDKALCIIVLITARIYINNLNNISLKQIFTIIIIIQFVLKS